MKKYKFLEITNLVNGNIEPIIINDVKYEADPEKPEEALTDNDGNKIVYTEEKEKKEETPVDVSKMSIEELSKSNPILAKQLEDAETAKKILADKEQEEKEAKEKKEEETGEWQKLANERKDKADRLEKENSKKDELLKKYKGSISNILNNAIEQIPEENRGLVPKDFSERQKLDYITENAKVLGIKSILNIGDKKIPDGDKPLIGTKEQQLVKELTDLQEKKDKTPVELDVMYEKSKELKSLRLENK